MTITDESPVDAARAVALAMPAAPSRSRLMQIWHLPLVAHALTLFVILTILVNGVIGTHSSFSADEGAAIIQARQLRRGDGWRSPQPLASVDPRGLAFGLDLSERGSRGITPFAKHPLYAVLLAGADAFGGVTGMVTLSVLGTVLAAFFAGLIARRLATGLERPALWALGLASPLLFDSALVIAHTLGAAAAGGAAWCALVVVDGRSDRRPGGPPVLGRRLVGCSAGLAAAVAVGVLLRSESLPFALALGALLVTLGVGRRAPLATLAGLGVGVVGLAARWSESQWITSIIGRRQPSNAVIAAPRYSLVRGRISGFVTTVLSPGYGTLREPAVALVASVLLAVVAGLAVRHRTGDPGTILLPAVLSAVAAVAAVAVGPAEAVPGLLVACPLLTVGLVLLRRSDLRSAGAALCGGTTSLFAMAVVATQYGQGGSFEWGGRYFAIALPLAVPLAVVAIVRMGGRLPAPVARVALVALLTSTTAVSTLAVLTLRRTHRAAERTVSEVLERSSAAAPGDGGQPVIVTTEPSLGRFAWDRYDQFRWLLVSPSTLPGTVDPVVGGRGASSDRGDHPSAPARDRPCDDVDLESAGTVERLPVRDADRLVTLTSS